MIKVSSTNATGKYPTAVRVYKDGVKVGEVFPTARNPLQYLRTFRRSKYNLSLIAQLTNAGLSEDEIAEVYGEEK